MERKELTIRLDADERVALDRVAASYGVSVAAALRMLLRAHMAGAVLAAGPMSLVPPGQAAGVAGAEGAQREARARKRKTTVRTKPKPRRGGK